MLKIQPWIDQQFRKYLLYTSKLIWSHCKVIQKLLSIYEKLLQQEGYRLKIDLSCGDAASLINENVGLSFVTRFKDSQYRKCYIVLLFLSACLMILVKDRKEFYDLILNRK